MVERASEGVNRRHPGQIVQFEVSEAMQTKELEIQAELRRKIKLEIQ